MKTQFAKSATISRDWHVIDANEKILGRVASKIASVLRGKHKAIYSPHVDTGDFVVVVNAKNIAVTGNKKEDKLYHTHTGYTGNDYSVSFQKQMETYPERVIEHAVKGMLPKGPLGRKMFKKLKVYAGSEHPHKAQNPQVLQF